MKDSTHCKQLRRPQARRYAVNLDSGWFYGNREVQTLSRTVTRSRIPLYPPPWSKPWGGLDNTHAWQLVPRTISWGGGGGILSNAQDHERVKINKIYQTSERSVG